VDAIASLYAPHVVRCSDAEHAAFVGNSIALSPDMVWVSAQAGRALTPANRECLRGAGFDIATVELDAIEAGGGSLRCCVGEIF
jgi:N-dimethylarginine dimethylaminohydrolase